MNNSVTLFIFLFFLLVFVYPQEIELCEALCGFQRVMKTLDKRGLLLVSPAGDVVKDGETTVCVCVCVCVCMHGCGCSGETGVEYLMWETENSCRLLLRLKAVCVLCCCCFPFFIVSW